MHTGDTTADHETAARQRSLALEAQGRLPAGFTEHYYPLTRLERLELARQRAALQLALDPGAWADLLCGVPIDPDRVDKEALQYALTASLVQLVRPIDLIHGRAA